MRSPLTRVRRCWLAGIAAALVSGSVLSARAAESEPRAAVSFDHDIAPLFTSRCAKCHGPSEGKAGLHLTDRDAATMVLPSGERAIVPGKPDESELLRRVSSKNPEERMPPKGPPLSAD